MKKCMSPFKLKEESPPTEIEFLPYHTTYQTARCCSGDSRIIEARKKWPQKQERKDRQKK